MRVGPHPHAELTLSRLRRHAAGRRRLSFFFCAWGPTPTRNLRRAACDGTRLAAGACHSSYARGAPPPRGTYAEPLATARGWPQALVILLLRVGPHPHAELTPSRLRRHAAGRRRLSFFLCAWGPAPTRNLR